MLCCAVLCWPVSRQHCHALLKLLAVFLPLLQVPDAERVLAEKDAALKGAFAAQLGTGGGRGQGLVHWCRCFDLASIYPCSLG